MQPRFLMAPLFCFSRCNLGPRGPPRITFMKFEKPTGSYKILTLKVCGSQDPSFVSGRAAATVYYHCSRGRRGRRTSRRHHRRVSLPLLSQEETSGHYVSLCLSVSCPSVSLPFRMHYRDFVFVPGAICVPQYYGFSELESRSRRENTYEVMR